MRHIRSEYSISENVLPLAARSKTFQSVGLSLQWLLPSRAIVRLTQHCKVKKNYLTQFIEQTPSSPSSRGYLPSERGEPLIFDTRVPFFDTAVFLFNTRVSNFNTTVPKLVTAVSKKGVRVFFFGTRVCSFDIQICFFDTQVCFFGLGVNWWLLHCSPLGNYGKKKTRSIVRPGFVV